MIDHGDGDDSFIILKLWLEWIRNSKHYHHYRRKIYHYLIDIIIIIITISSIIYLFIQMMIFIPSNLHFVLILINICIQLYHHCEIVRFAWRLWETTVMVSKWIVIMITKVMTMMILIDSEESICNQSMKLIKTKSSSK